MDKKKILTDIEKVVDDWDGNTDLIKPITEILNSYIIDIERIQEDAYYNGMTMRPDFEKHSKKIATKLWEQYNDECYHSGCHDYSMDFISWLYKEE